MRFCAPPSSCLCYRHLQRKSSHSSVRTCLLKEHCPISSSRPSRKLFFQTFTLSRLCQFTNTNAHSAGTFLKSGSNFPRPTVKNPVLSAEQNPHACSLTHPLSSKAADGMSRITATVKIILMKAEAKKPLKKRQVTPPQKHHPRLPLLQKQSPLSSRTPRQASKGLPSLKIR